MIERYSNCVRKHANKNMYTALNKLENVTITVVLPRAASRCARTRSHSLALACPRQNSFVLARYRSSTCFRTRISRTCCNLLADAWTRLPARWLELVHFRSNSLELARSVLQNHSVFTRFFMLFRRKWIHLLRSYQILWKYFKRYQTCDSKT